jgi:hypothetical protein
MALLQDGEAFLHLVDRRAFGLDYVGESMMMRW